jgi:hypothetical protein
MKNMQQQCRAAMQGRKLARTRAAVHGGLTAGLGKKKRQKQFDKI